MAAVIGLLELELFLPGCGSLKEKRMRLKSLKDRSARQFNAGMAETAFQDKWQRAGITFVMVGSSEKIVQEALNKLFSFWDQAVEVEVTTYNFEFR